MFMTQVRRYLCLFTMDYILFSLLRILGMR